MRYPNTNEELIDYLQRERHIRTPAVVAAFRAVDRGDFVSPKLHKVRRLRDEHPLARCCDGMVSNLVFSSRESERTLGFSRQGWGRGEA